MQLIQIGTPETMIATQGISVREMFEQMAAREAKMIRESRERAAKQFTATHDLSL
jgi:hypothetical protein